MPPPFLIAAVGPGVLRQHPPGKEGGVPGLDREWIGTKAALYNSLGNGIIPWLEVKISCVAGSADRVNRESRTVSFTRKIGLYSTGVKHGDCVKRQTPVTAAVNSEQSTTITNPL